MDRGIDKNDLYRMSCDKPSIRFVCSSTIPLSEREPSATEFRLSPLGAEDRATIVESYLGRYGKGLSPSNVSKITSNGFMDNPLNLVAVCDLLRVYGDFDTFNEHVERTSSISNLSQLLDAVTENLGRVLSEIGVDPRVTSDILNLVAFSYRGVRERDMGRSLE